MGRPLPSALEGALAEPRVEPALRELVRERFGPCAELAGISCEIVKRRVVRYAIDVQRAGESAPSPWRVIGKVYESPARGEHGFRTLRWLWGNGFQEMPPAGASLPEPYAYLAEVQTLLMEEVGGESLKGLLKSGRARPADMRLFAEALAKLHRFPLSFGRPFTFEDHLEERCAGLTASLAASFPELARSIRMVVETARRRQHCTRTLCHGDYHPGQVHVQGERLWILDLDPLNWGDPAYDLAMVLVVLKRMALGSARAHYFRSMLDAFLTAYFARMDPRVARRVPLNAALILLKRACKRFRWQDEPGWQDTIRAQMRQAVDCLALQDELAPPRSLDDVIEIYERCPATA